MFMKIAVVLPHVWFAIIIIIIIASLVVSTTLLGSGLLWHSFGACWSCLQCVQERETEKQCVRVVRMMIRSG
jgi:hypothetical protein